MCITRTEVNQKMEEIKSLKMLREETENAIKALEMEVIGFLQENMDECRTTNKSGKEILQFIGNICKATYSAQERETVDKNEVKKLLDSESYRKVSKVSCYNVLRIS